MGALPTGTVTFLFTDIEQSVRLWERYPSEMRLALARHDRLIETLAAEHHGSLVRPRGEGDSRFAVFARATDGVAAASAIQNRLQTEAWETPEPLRVRMALHTGESDLREGDYYGGAVNRCARLRAIAYGGQILVSGVTAALVGDRLPAESSLRDLGSHRLKDLGQPERVYQLTTSENTTDFPPLRSTEALRTNLPLQSASFVGRAHELAELRQLLERERLVTLTGSGGAGKTRLAMRVAGDLTPRFDDGVWLADLGPLSYGSLLPRAVAQAVGVVEEAGRSLWDSLLDHLRLRQIMLVLDNCEHVVRGCATLADAVLRACPRVHLLITSREPLALPGEIVWPVPPLAVPGRDAPMERIGAADAVHLFVDRAESNRPDFALTDGNASAVAEICRRLDGMPLAIELAAARVRVLSPQQIAARLDDRFRLLAGGSRTAPSRQHTLRAAIDWSHDLLSPQEQAVFARLAVFNGGLDLEAAEAVCVDAAAKTDTSGDAAISASDILDLLSLLIDKSLLIGDASPDDGLVRYRMLETLRSYARERLAERGESNAVQRSHARHFAIQASVAEAHLRGPEQAAWLDRLEVDHDNVLSALKWTVDSGELETGLLLGTGIIRFWLTRHPREGSEWFSKLLTGPQKIDPAIRARGLNLAGSLALAQGDVQQAALLLETCVSLRRSLGDARELGVALIAYGALLLELGQIDSARINFEEALEIRQDLGDRRGSAVVLASLAEVARRSGDLPRAASLGNASLALAREAGDAHIVATALNNLGSVATAQGDYGLAATLLEDAMRRFTVLGDRRVVAECCQRLAEVARLRGLGITAARLLGASAAQRKPFESALQPAERDEYDRVAAATQHVMAEADYLAAWSAGRASALDEVLAEAYRELLPVRSG
jgi:predicted ATPase/class 3 adenylate cyclase